MLAETISIQQMCEIIKKSELKEVIEEEKEANIYIHFKDGSLIEVFSVLELEDGWKPVLKPPIFRYIR